MDTINVNEISKVCRNMVIDSEGERLKEKHLTSSYERIKLQKEYNEKVIELLHPNQRPSVVGIMSEPDPKTQYEFVRFDKVETKHPIEYLEPSKLDYVVKNIDKVNNKLKDDMPVSFLAIEEGDVASGKEWYKHYDPKLPDELCEMMARHNWGDLKHMTKKTAKNTRKKLDKKGKDLGVEMGLTIRRTDKNNPIVLTFD
tara:strand:- start:170 stop:766 length:597 start_codon:yes stop_codon:yes gene_type:complete